MRIALLEDDPDQVAIITLWLRSHDHSVASFGSGAEFLRAQKRDSHDLYILDWMLPDISGIEVLSMLRDERHDDTPVLVATARNEERYIVQALEAGADDYLAKPIRERELVARINALRRRATGHGRDSSLSAGRYRLDRRAKRIELDGEEISLTNREFDLAEFFFSHAGNVVSRAHILESVWGIDNAEVSTRTVDTHISRLRKKLALGEENGWKLAAIYQHGYRLESTAPE